MLIGEHSFDADYSVVVSIRDNVKIALLVRNTPRIYTHHAPINNSSLPQSQTPSQEKDSQLVSYNLTLIAERTIGVLTTQHGLGQASKRCKRANTTDIENTLGKMNPNRICTKIVLPILPPMLNLPTSHIDPAHHTQLALRSKH